MNDAKTVIFGKKIILKLVGWGNQ